MPTYENIDAKAEWYRQFCLERDLYDVRWWTVQLEQINNEIETITPIELQLLKNNKIEATLIGMRRKNTLTLGRLYQYERELLYEKEYGKESYEAGRARRHQVKRAHFQEIQDGLTELRNLVYNELKKYKRK